MKINSIKQKTSSLWQIMSFLLCLGLSLSMGCIETVDPQGLVNTASRVVIGSLISPDEELTKVQVSSSIPTFGTRAITDSDSDLIKDAIVLLSGGGETASLTYNEEEKSYTVRRDEFRIKEDTRYLLEVITGGVTYTATCQVPRRTVYNIDVEASKRSDGFRLRVLWDDAPGVSNYYNVTARHIREDIGFGTDITSVDFYENAFQEDTNRDGRKLSAATDVYVYSLNGGSSDHQDSVEVQLFITDENSYDYLESVFWADYNEGNPFVEPTKVPSSIDGALGVFGAYLVEEKKIKVIL